MGRSGFAMRLSNTCANLRPISFGLIDSVVRAVNIDNIFREPIGRFSEIEEDEAPKHLLVSDYDKMLGTAA